MAKLWKLVVLIVCCTLLSAALIRAEEETTETKQNEVADEPAADIPEEEKTAADETEDDEESDGPKEEDGVLVLTSENFDDVVDDAELILVEFYAPWCGHCKSLAPQYAGAAKKLKDNDPPVPLAKVDATEEKDLASRFEVSGYPTLKFFKNGQAFEYEGPRDESGIVKYMQERADPNWKPPPEAVLTLTSDNFTSTIEGAELILVEFYAPWCGHCKKLAPEYEKAAQDLKNHDPPIPLAKVDATSENDLAQKYDVSGYPTMKVFRKGKPYDYNGGRDKYGIVDYMQKQVGDASKDKGGLKNVQNFMKKDDITIVAFFETDSDQLFDAYMEAANIMREDFDFGHSFDPEARNFYKVNPGSVMVFNADTFYTKHEPKWHVFDKADATAADVQSFIDGHMVPLVGHYSFKTKDKRYADKRPLVLFFYTVDFSFDYRDATQLWRRKIADIAKDYRDDFTFAIANEDEFGDLFRGFGFDDSGEEMNIGILGPKDTKYPMEPMEEFDSEEIRSFLAKFKKGEVKAKLKSAPAPKKQSGPVTVVVGNTFDKIVMDKKKDVFIELYAPWCGHCKKLEPVYKELAKKFKKNKNIVIAKMDATANDAPGSYAAEGFPTIYFATRDRKDNPIKYEGGRELKDMVSFIEENASVTVEAKKDEL